MIAIDLSKQQTLDADPKAMQQFHFAGNKDEHKYITMFFITEESRETILDFPQGTARLL